MHNELSTDGFSKGLAGAMPGYSQQLGNGRRYIGKRGARPQVIIRLYTGAGDAEWYAFPGMIRTGQCRIVAVIGRDD